MISFILLVINLFVCTTCSPFTEVQQGILRGQFLKTYNNRTFSSFTAIPYAEPPVGDLRFELARPAKRWNGTLDATKLHPVCPQLRIMIEESKAEGNEDCLYLNVYTPQVEFSNIGELFPVIIYIHGGGFAGGNANRDLHNPDILLDKNIVLVTPNYRLGALGFLTTGDDVVPGNNGLKDQNLAMKWVNENIIAFGGDPNCVTIWGQSAGAGSVHFHMLSPMSRGLFNRVIAQSGTAFGYWALAPNDQGSRNARKLALSVNCSTAYTEEMVKCLKKVDAFEIAEHQHSFYEWFIHPELPFKPAIEPNTTNAFLTENPAEIIKSGKAAKVPLLTGITTQDGAFRSSVMFERTHLIDEFNGNFTRLAPFVFFYEEIATDKDHVTRRIKDFYFKNNTITNSSQTELTDVFTDSMFLTGANNALWLHLNYTEEPVYYYVFGYRGNYSFSSVRGNDSFDFGVGHSDDLMYLFSPKLAFPDYEPSSSDKVMRNTLTTLWANFAKFGNPTPTSEELEEWKAVKSANLEYYFINNFSHMDEKLYWDRTQLWKSFPLM